MRRHTIIQAQLLLDLENLAAWPDELQAYLDRHYDLLLGWEAGKVSGLDYDRVICGLQYALEPYGVVGWHCTRLTELECAKILSSGMQLPDRSILCHRLDTLLRSGLLTKALTERLKAENQADDEHRAGMIWFCLYPPYLAGKGGIERFFRSWGGEALYNSHEDDPETGVTISDIGRPCLVEASVPIASMGSSISFTFKIARRYLISRGFETREPLDHDAWSKLVLPAANIRRIIKYPEPDFLSLTGCATWKTPLGWSTP